MSTNCRFFRNVLQVYVLSALSALSAGCASLDVPDPLGGDAGIARTRRQRAEEAVREFESKRDFAEFQAALGQWDRGDVEACEESLQRLLSRNPDHSEARMLLAQVSAAGQRQQAALERVEQAPPVHPGDVPDDVPGDVPDDYCVDAPGDARSQYTTGLLLEATGQGSNALAYYGRAAESDPDNELYSAGYQGALRAARQADPSSVEPPARPDDSPESSRAPAPLIPDPTAAASETVSCLVGHGPDRPRTSAPAGDAARDSTTPGDASRTETADRADLADSAEAGEPDPVRALLGKGREALAEGSPQAALDHFRKAAATRPNDPQIPIATATAALRHEQPDLAVKLLLPAERRFPDSARLHRILGLAHYRLGDYRSAQVALRQALSLDKSSALSYLLMGYTLSKLGQFESAEAHLRQARTINPRYTVRR